MASFNSDYYSTGGMDFQTGYSERLRETRGAQSVYDQPRASVQPPQYAAPSRPTYDTYSDGFDDDLGDYIPGSTVSGARSPYADSIKARQSQQMPVQDEVGFDDDFDDAFDDAPERGFNAASAAPQQIPQPQYAGGRRGRYGVYSDYSNEEFDAEYGGLPTIGSRRRREEQPQQEQQVRPQIQQGFARESVPVVSDDGYYNGSTVSDTPFNAQVPSIFSSYFDEQYLASQQTSRNKKNKANSYQHRRHRRMMTTFASVLSVAVLAVSMVVYFTMFHVSDPLNVKTAFSEMSADTSQTLIKQSVDSTLSQQSIIISVNGRTGSFQLSNYGFEYTSDQGAADEYIELTDDEGNVTTQTITTLGSLRFNETLVREFLYSVVGSEGIRMEEPSYEIDYQTGVMTVKAGTNGYGIDYDHFMQEVLNRIVSGNYYTIECSMAETVAPDVDIQEIYNKVHCLVSDATKTYDGAGQVVYTEDIVGVDFDVNAACSQIAAGGSEWNISLVLTQPNLTLVELKAPDCPDLLASYTSYYNGDNKARATNLALAAKYITENGYLEPGDQLSFNGTVGERTPERGFNKATVYSSEGTDEDYGGGICQTSSTLYYTCVLANLEIVERHNHLYTVSYMTDTEGVQRFGNDATVNWGTLDLVIANNREYPIRIEFVCTTGAITCNIYGTWNGITADLRYVENSTESYKVIYRPAQTGKSSQAGQLGRIIQTYRVVFQDGVEIDRYREALSSYIPLNEVRYTNNLPAGREYYVEY